MSTTITAPGPRQSAHKPQFTAERTIPRRPRRPDTLADTIVRAQALRERGRLGIQRRVTDLLSQVEGWVQCCIVAVLIGIAIATMAYTTVTLLTTSSSFAEATNSAVGGMLIVLILVEITRTIITGPDGIRRLLLIAIMSGLREVLWIGVSAGNAHGEMGKPLTMAIVTVIVIGLAGAFALVGRSSGSDKS
jgi:uncharacterized membrane protein (DUF373 family)